MHNFSSICSAPQTLLAVIYFKNAGVAFLSGQAETETLESDDTLTLICFLISSSRSTHIGFVFSSEGVSEV